MPFTVNALVLSALAGLALASPTAEMQIQKRHPDPYGWTQLGCYTDDVNARALKFNGNIPGGPGAVSWESCTQACLSAGLAYAGVEYGNQCYCDNKINNQGLAPDGNALCNMNCAADQGEICGGPARINIFKSQTIGTYAYQCPGGRHNNPFGWTLLGCYTDDPGARALKYNGNVPGGPGAVTWESCTQACDAAGLPYAGVEYGGECYCDNKINNQGLAPDGDVGCSMNCKGDQGELCGGPNRINIFQSNSIPGAAYHCGWTDPSTST